MVVLYTTGCPRCKVLESNLKKRSIDFDVIEGSEPIRKLGYVSAPILDVDGRIMTYPAAMNWLLKGQGA